MNYKGLENNSSFLGQMEKEKTRIISPQNNRSEIEVETVITFFYFKEAVKKSVIISHLRK